MEQVDLYNIFNVDFPTTSYARREEGVVHPKFSEEMAYFMVDEVGDEEYENSKWWKFGDADEIVPLDE